MTIFTHLQPQSINWESEDSYVLLNPRAPFAKNDGLRKRLNELIEEHQLKSHIFLLTSGSTALSNSSLKWVALAKSAILASSQAVNEHLNSTKNDLILNPLPFFHIGGLSIYSRTYLTGAKSIHTYSENVKWNPVQFVDDLDLHKATLTSLVPTQIFDLINAKLPAPASLRYAVVGGGSLDKNIFLQAQNLGWNLLPSYGMTECCSQIATAAPGFKWENDLPPLKILPHLSVSLDDDGIISVSGKSLLTGYLMMHEEKNQNSNFANNAESTSFFSPMTDGFIRTTDRGKLLDNTLYIYGRVDDTIKIGGETVSLTRLDGILENIKMQLLFAGDLALFSIGDPRLGRKIGLAVVQNEAGNKDLINRIVSLFNNEVFPFEKIRETYFIPTIPRTELGKLKRAALSNYISIQTN